MHICLVRLGEPAIVWVFFLPWSANDHAIYGDENTQKQFRGLPHLDYASVHEVSLRTTQYELCTYTKYEITISLDYLSTCTYFIRAILLCRACSPRHK